MACFPVGLVRYGAGVARAIPAIRRNAVELLCLQTFFYRYKAGGPAAQTEHRVQRALFLDVVIARDYTLIHRVNRTNVGNEIRWNAAHGIFFQHERHDPIPPAIAGSVVRSKNFFFVLDVKTEFLYSIVRAFPHEIPVPIINHVDEHVVHGVVIMRQCSFVIFSAMVSIIHVYIELVGEFGYVNFERVCLHDLNGVVSFEFRYVVKTFVFWSVELAPVIYTRNDGLVSAHGGTDGASFPDAYFQIPDIAFTQEIVVKASRHVSRHTFHPKNVAGAFGFLFCGVDETLFQVVYVFVDENHIHVSVLKKQIITHCIHMKKKYVAMLVALAMCLVAIVGYVIYSNWSEITSDITAAVRTLTKVKDAIRRMKPDTAKIVVQKPETILALAPSNPELTSQIADITRAANLAQRDADVVNTETAGVVENQAKTRRAEAVPLKAIVLNNAKQKNIEEQKRASQEYAEVLKKIEEEKVRAGVLLTAIQTEKQKIAKIDALDREISHAPLFPAVHLVRPVSKQDMNSIIADM